MSHRFRKSRLPSSVLIWFSSVPFEIWRRSINSLLPSRPAKSTSFFYGPASTTRASSIATLSYKTVRANIYADEYSRVVLKRQDSQQNDYINANHIQFEDRRYIITQGPLPTTVNDFFLMVAQEKVKTIVMLCNVVEEGKVRCEAYFDNLPEPFRLEST